MNSDAQSHEDAAFDRIVDDLNYTYAGVFARDEIAEVVRESRDLIASRSTVHGYQFVLTERFARDRLAAQAKAKGMRGGGQPEVLFVCVRNAGRSQLASALTHHRSGGRVHVRSAGSQPGEAVHDAVVQVMSEIGVPMTEAFPKPLTDDVVRASDVVVSMGCGDACPYYPGKTYLEWDLADPAELPLDQVRILRDEIDLRVQDLLAQLLPDMATS